MSEHFFAQNEEHGAVLAVEKEDFGSTLIATSRTIREKFFERVRQAAGSLFDERAKKQLTLGISIAALNVLSACAATKAVEKEQDFSPKDVHQEAAQRSDEKIADQAKKFRAEVSRFKGLGYKVQAAGGYVIDSSSVEKSARSFATAIMEPALSDIAHRNNVSRYVDGTVDDFIAIKYGINKEIDPSLAESDTLQIPSLQLQVSGGKDGQLTLRFIDLSLDEPLVYQTNLDAVRAQSNKGNFFTAEQQQELDVLFASEQDRTKEQVFLDSIQPEHIEKKNFTYELLSDQPVSQEEIKNLEAIFSTCDMVTIEALPAGAEIDRPPVDLRLTKEILARNAYSKVKVNGQVRELFFRKFFPESEQGKATTSSVEIKCEKDNFGNIVLGSPIRTLERIEADGGKYWKEVGRSFIVQPPLALLSNGEEPRAKELCADLTYLSLPQFTGLLQCMPEASVRKIGEYGIFTNLSSENFLKIASQRSLEEAASGIHDAENLFGLEEGGAVDSIYVVNSRRANAFVNRKDPRIVNLQDEIFKEKGSQRVTGFHETIHVIDLRFGITADDALKKLHTELLVAGSFFAELNEDHFLPNVENAGHAQDNPAEFLASMFNSMNHPDLEKALSAKSSEFRAAYKEAIEGVLNRCSAIEKIPRDAPVFSQLKKVLNMLQ